MKERKGAGVADLSQLITPYILRNTTEPAHIDHVKLVAGTCMYNQQT